MTVRDDIATAASQVAGVIVTPYYKQTTRAGNGWVSIQRIDRDDTGLGYMDRWAVTICLPQDVAAAERWMETNVDDLIEALSAELVITTVVPVTLALDSGNLPGLSIEGSRGH